MRCLFLVAITTGALSAQSMVEFGAVAAGSAVGGVAGKKVSESITSTFTRTGGVLKKAEKDRNSTSTPPIPQAVSSSSRVPTLQVSPGVPKSGGSGSGSRFAVSEPNNVPLPPPPRRAAKAPSSRPAPVPVALVEPQPEPAHVPHNVDLDAILQGMPRVEVLALGEPSARITMFEDGHLVELYHYRNESLPSGAVRLIDGTVAAIQLHP